MNRLLKITFIVCSCLFMFGATASAQRTVTKSNSNNGNTTEAIIKGTGKATVIVVGSAAKIVWATTKFSAKYIAEPAAVKVAPKIAIATLKTSGIAAKYLLPFAVKLSLF
jgi:hypothetical protein